LPHSEASPWKLVCQLPYNAQYTAWIQVKTDAAGKVVEFDSTNPLVRSRQKAQTYTTVAGDQAYEVPEWVSGEGACYTIPAGVTVVAVKFRETGYDTRVAGSLHVMTMTIRFSGKRRPGLAISACGLINMDCPDRERSEWLGDAVLEWRNAFTPTICHRTRWPGT